MRMVFAILFHVLVFGKSNSTSLFLPRKSVILHLPQLFKEYFHHPVCHMPFQSTVTFFEN